MTARSNRVIDPRDSVGTAPPIYELQQILRRGAGTQRLTMPLFHRLSRIHLGGGIPRVREKGQSRALHCFLQSLWLHETQKGDSAMCTRKTFLTVTGAAILAVLVTAVAAFAFPGDTNYLT